MGFMAIDDKTARLEVVMRPAVYESIKDNIKEDMVVMIYGEVSEDTFNGGIKLDAEQVVSLAEARIEKARALKLFVDEATTDLNRIHDLKVLLGSYQADNGLPIVVDYKNQMANVQMKTNDGIVYFPDDELIETLRSQGWQPEVVL